MIYEDRKDEHYIQTEYGYCYYRIWDSTIPGPFVYNLFVNPLFRRKGYAKKLLTMVMDEIKSLVGDREIYIESEPFDSDGPSKIKLTQFYKKMGLIVLQKEG